MDTFRENLGASVMLLEYERHPSGPRVRVVGQRVHHGALGVLLAVALRHHPRACALALTVALEDLHDWRHWFAPGAQR